MVETVRAPTDGLPPDPAGQAVAAIITDVLVGASVQLQYQPDGAAVAPPARPLAAGAVVATGPGPQGWQVLLTLRLSERVARLLDPDGPGSLGELVSVLPGAALRAAEQFRRRGRDDEPLSPSLRRALRDAVAAEVLRSFLEARLRVPIQTNLIAEIIDYLIELGGVTIETHDVSHGLVVADVLRDTPRLELRYPSDLRAAKRAPLLFDGQRAVLVVDPLGRARTELQRHRVDRLAHDRTPVSGRSTEAGSLVAEATRTVGGLGFFLRTDGSIWTFVDGQPLLVRRGEHWTAFPVELTAAIASMIGGGDVAGLVARAAFIISGQPGGAILAIVDGASDLDGVVSLKDRYDLRNEVDPGAMRPETRLHHLIEGEDLDHDTLVRLAILDGATVVDQQGRLLAYGAIVSSADSQHEGARTAAARTLSLDAKVVLKVSADGDITIFRGGEVITTLLDTPR